MTSFLSNVDALFQENGCPLAAGRPLAGRSRSTDVPVRIFLIPFFSTLAKCVIPD